MNLTCNVIFSLYREYIRQIRRLPHFYLRQFFRLKASDDIRTLLRTSNVNGLVRKRNFKRVSKDLCKIKAANTGSTKAFAHILDLAYGRKGKLRWEIMEPILNDPNAPVPPRIIPSEIKSRPPVYSPELRALLTSTHSRTTKALERQSLAFPPKLTRRADPSSEEAHLLGPLSKRREVNIRWRYFVSEWKKVRPPLQVVVANVSGDMVHYGTTKDDVRRADLRGLGMQGSGIFEEIEALVGPPWMPRPSTRKERETSKKPSHGLISDSPLRHPSRWLRRRYQELLGRLPILSYSGRKRTGSNVEGYSVSLSRRAIAPSERYSSNRLAEVDPAALAWLERADMEDQKGELCSRNASTKITKQMYK